jgi:hypothetical protein
MGELKTKAHADQCLLYSPNQPLLSSLGKDPMGGENTQIIGDFAQQISHHSSQSKFQAQMTN